MAIAFVAAGVAVITPTNNTATSVNPLPPVEAAVGQYMLAFVTVQAAGANNDPVVTPPDGWVLHVGGNDPGSGTSTRINVYGKPYTGDEADFVWDYTAPSGGNAAAFIACYSGVDLAEPVVSGEAAYSGALGNTVRTTASISVADIRMLVAGWSDRNGSTYTTAHNLRRQIQAGGSVSLMGADAGNVTAGSHSMTATASASTTVASAAILALKTASSVVPEENAEFALSLALTVEEEHPPTPVEVFMADEPVYVAHRGGSVDYVENTMAAFDAAVAYGAKALEASIHRSIDGVWVISHDATTTRMFGDTYNIPDTTWAVLETLRTTDGDHPMVRLTDLLDAYGDTHIIFVDNKWGNWFVNEWLDLMDSYAGASRYVSKHWWDTVVVADLVRARGYHTWGYYYEENLPDMAETQGAYDYLGMEYLATQGAWDDTLAYGKPVLGHVILNAANATEAFSKGANGIMTGKVIGVIPQVIPSGSAITQTVTALSIQGEAPLIPVPTGSVATETTIGISVEGASPTPTVPSGSAELDTVTVIEVSGESPTPSVPQGAAELNTVTTFSITGQDPAAVIPTGETSLMTVTSTSIVGEAPTPTIPSGTTGVDLVIAFTISGSDPTPEIPGPKSLEAISTATTLEAVLDTDDDLIHFGGPNG